VAIEQDLAALLPRRDWTVASQLLIWHGRRRCHARRPACGVCPLDRLCPSYGEGPTDPVQAARLVTTEGRA
jgi:endonuclease III